MPRLAGRKLLILQAAAALFAQKGYEATTVVQIAKAADSNVGSLMHFYPSKSLLALAVRDSVASDLAAAVRAALERHPREVARAIESAIAAYLAWAAWNPEQMVLLSELVNVRLGSQITGRESLDKVSGVLQEWATPLWKLDILPSMEPAHLLATILGPAIIFALTCGPEHLESLGDPDVAEALASRVLRGLFGTLKGKGRGVRADARSSTFQPPAPVVTAGGAASGQLDLGLLAP